jgi:hypothetical protein
MSFHKNRNKPAKGTVDGSKILVTVRFEADTFSYLESYADTNNIPLAEAVRIFVEWGIEDYKLYKEPIN